MMEEILQRYREGHVGQAVPAQVLAAAARHASIAAGSGCPFGHGGRGGPAEGLPAAAAQQATATASSGCPFGHGGAAAAATKPEGAHAAAAGGGGSPDTTFSSFEAARQQLYSWEGVPSEFASAVHAETARQAEQLGLVPHASSSGGSGGPNKPLAFLDHAWGQVAPLTQVRRWHGGSGNSMRGVHNVIF